MKTKVITAAAVLGITALASLPAPANAAGCLKGALIGGLAGHFAGHGILGAGAGCLVGRHYANRTPRTQMTQSQTRTVTRDYDTTMNRPLYQYGDPRCVRGSGDAAAAERGDRLRIVEPRADALRPPTLIWN